MTDPIPSHRAGVGEMAATLDEDGVLERLRTCADGPPPGPDWSTEPRFYAVPAGRDDLRRLLDAFALILAAQSTGGEAREEAGAAHPLDLALRTPEERNGPHVGEALVACDGYGHGCVLVARGCVEEAISEWGRDLCDIGLDAAPAGLSVWTGRMVGWGPDHSGDFDAELRGEFRTATAADVGPLLPTPSSLPVETVRGMLREAAVAGNAIAASPLRPTEAGRIASRILSRSKPSDPLGPPRWTCAHGWAHKRGEDCDCAPGSVAATDAPARSKPLPVVEPVVRTCGGCRSCVPYGGYKNNRPVVFCDHAEAPGRTDVAGESGHLVVDDRKPPPDWCPLRTPRKEQKR